MTKDRQPVVGDKIKIIGALFYGAPLNRGDIVTICKLTKDNKIDAVVDKNGVIWSLMDVIFDFVNEKEEKNKLALFDSKEITLKIPAELVGKVKIIIEK